MRLGLAWLFVVVQLWLFGCSGWVVFGCWSCLYAQASFLFWFFVLSFARLVPLVCCLCSLCRGSCLWVSVWFLSDAHVLLFKAWALGLFGFSLEACAFCRLFVFLCQRSTTGRLFCLVYARLVLKFLSLFSFACCFSGFVGVSVSGENVFFCFFL